MLMVELLVIDNNSTDSTAKVVASFAELVRFPVNYVFEEMQGLSHARNRGVKEAKGRILAFTDDDVLVESNWLVDMEKAFDDDTLACAGGKILPLWEKARPRWLTSDLYGFLALLDLGDEPLQLKEADIFGANFIVRAEMFQQYGTFTIGIGRTEGKLYAGEESEFIERLISGGEQVCYLPTLVVHHQIPARRMKKSYFRKWVYDNSVLRAHTLGHHPQRSIAGIPFYAFKELIRAVLSYLLTLMFLKYAFMNELRVIRSVVFVVSRLHDGSNLLKSKPDELRVYNT